MAEDREKEGRFTPAALAAHAGEEGQPVYVAYKGKVYDVSGSPLWRGGRHMGTHGAGADLTGEFADAPHGEEVFERYPQVGVLIKDRPHEDSQLTPARQFWQRQIKRVPLLRRHPHPMVVHFPIVFMISATVFTLLYLLTEVRSFEVTGFHCLAGGVLFTPVAMITGWFTWWLNYESRYLKPVVIKLILSPVLFFIGVAAFLWRFFNPEILAHGWDWQSVVYLTLIGLGTPLVGVIGAYGALITFPLHND